MVLNQLFDFVDDVKSSLEKGSNIAHGIIDNFNDKYARGERLINKGISINEVFSKGLNYTFKSYINDFSGIINDFIENTKKTVEKEVYGGVIIDVDAEDVTDDRSSKKSIDDVILVKEKVPKKKEETINVNLDDMVVYEDKPWKRDYLGQASDVTDLYNQGYTTRYIVQEAKNQGFKNINNKDDVLMKVASGISNGMTYSRDKYDGRLAEMLGAKEQIINDYISGKSYKEIKKNLGKNTNGMKISNSSIYRTLRSYEEKTGKQVIRRRIFKH